MLKSRCAQQMNARMQIRHPICKATIRVLKARRNHAKDVPKTLKKPLWCQSWCQMWCQNGIKQKQVRRFNPSDLLEVVEPDSRLELLAYALRVRRSTN